MLSWLLAIKLFGWICSSFAFAGELEIGVPMTGARCQDLKQTYGCISQNLPDISTQDLDLQIKSDVLWDLTSRQPEHVFSYVRGVQVYEATKNEALALRAIDEERNRILELKQSGAKDDPYLTDMTFKIFEKLVDAPGIEKGALGPFMMKVVGILRDVDAQGATLEKDSQIGLFEEQKRIANRVFHETLKYSLSRSNNGDEKNIYSKLTNRALTGPTGLSLGDSPQKFLDKSPTYNRAFLSFGIAMETKGDLERQNAIVVKIARQLARRIKAVEEREKQRLLDQRSLAAKIDYYKKLDQQYDDSEKLFGSFARLGGLCRVEWCRPVSQVANFAAATTSLMNTALQYNRGVNDAATIQAANGSLKSVSGMAMSAATLNYVAVAVSLFSAGQPSEMAEVMKELQEIQKQIADLTKLMLDNFRRLDLAQATNFERTILVLNATKGMVYHGFERINARMEKAELQVRQKKIFDDQVSAQDLASVCLSDQDMSRSQLRECWTNKIFGTVFNDLNGTNYRLLSRTPLLSLGSAVSPKTALAYFPAIYQEAQAQGASAPFPQLFDPAAWLARAEVASLFLQKRPGQTERVKPDLKRILSTGKDIQNWIASLIGVGSANSGLDDLGLIGKQLDAYVENFKKTRTSFNEILNLNHVTTLDLAGNINVPATGHKLQWPEVISLCADARGLNRSRFFIGRKFPAPRNLSDWVDPEIRSRMVRHGGAFEVCYNPLMTGGDGTFHPYENLFGADWQRAFISVRVDYFPPESKKPITAGHAMHQLLERNEFNENKYLMADSEEFGRLFLARAQSQWNHMIDTLTPKLTNAPEVDVYRSERKIAIAKAQKELEMLFTDANRDEHHPLKKLTSTATLLRALLSLTLSQDQFEQPAIAANLALFTKSYFSANNDYRMLAYLAESDDAEKLYLDKIEGLRKQLRLIRQRTKTFGPDEFVSQLKFLESLAR